VFEDLLLDEALEGSSEIGGQQQAGYSELHDEEPATVLVVPRLQDDVFALKQIFSAEVPAQLLLRPAHGAYAVIYGGGDA